MCWCVSVEGNLGDEVSSFQLYVGSGDRTQILLAQQALYQLSCFLCEGFFVKLSRKSF